MVDLWLNWIWYYGSETSQGLAGEIRDQNYLDILDPLATEWEDWLRITNLFQSQYMNLSAVCILSNDCASR